MSKVAKTFYGANALAFLATAALWTFYRLHPASWCLAACITCGTTFYHLFMRLMVGGPLVPIRHRSGDGWFRQKSWEPKLYRALKVKTWKSRMPSFEPAQWSLKETPLPQIIQNSRRAEMIHEIYMVLSFVPLLAIPRFGAAGVFWATSLCAALFDSCFVIMQRYNRPRLERILEKETSKA